MAFSPSEAVGVVKSFLPPAACPAGWIQEWVGEVRDRPAEWPPDNMHFVLLVRNQAAAWSGLSAISFPHKVAA
jgi:hypothetical protein